MSKEKSPAFQWYPKDVLTSLRVQMLSLAEEGAYRRALDLCWLNNCCLPNDAKKIAQLIGKGCTVKIAQVVMGMFDPHPKDSELLIHDKLKSIKAKQDEWRKKSSDAGKKSGEKRNQNKTKVKPKSNQPSNQNTNHSSNQNATLHSASSSSLNTDTPLIPQGELGGGEMPEELKIKARQVAVFFKIGEVEQYQRFSEICNFIICLNHRKRLDFFLKQFASYLIYLRQQKDFKGYGLNKFMGTGPQYFEDGAWNDRDWAKAVKPEQKVLSKAKNHQ